MSSCPARWIRSALLGVALAACAVATAAQDAARLRSQALAATCAHCHGLDGRSVPGDGLAPLAGRPKDVLLSQLLAFRNGQRPATVMHQLTKGYSQEQLEALAAYFAALK